MPKGTRVSRCVEKVKKQGKDEGAAIAICQDSTKQGYATGRNLKEALYERLGKMLAERMSFSQTQVDAMKKAAKPLNPAPKPAKAPSLKGDAKKKSQELTAQDASVEDLEEAVPLAAAVGAGVRTLAGPLLRKAAAGLGRTAGQGTLRRKAATGLRGAAKDPKKMKALGQGAEHLTQKALDKRAEMENQSTQYSNPYVKKLMESKPSREVVETPGGKMTVARSKITGGQYQKSHGDTEGSKKSGKEAAKMISQARRERLARQGMVPPRVGGRTRRGMRDHTEYDQKGQGIAEAGPKGKIEAAYGETPHGREQYKKLSSRPNDPSPVERARMRREAAAENQRFRKTSMKDHTEYQRIGALMAEAMGLFETQYRGRSFIPKKPDTKDSGLPKTVGTPSERTPEAAAAGKKRAEQRRAELKAHMAKKSEEARAERAKRAAGQTLDPYTGKPKK